MTPQDVMVWWKIAARLDEARTSLSTVVPRSPQEEELLQAFDARLREGQSSLLQIFSFIGILSSEPVVGMQVETLSAVPSASSVEASKIDPPSPLPDAGSALSTDVEALPALTPPEAPSIAEHLHVVPDGVAEPGERFAGTPAVAGTSSKKFRKRNGRGKTRPSKPGDPEAAEKIVDTQSPHLPPAFLQKDVLCEEVPFPSSGGSDEKDPVPRSQQQAPATLEAAFSTNPGEEHF